jgi:hypothetical protein
VSTSLHDHADLTKHLERWVDEELISRAEAEAISTFEQRGEAQPHRISLVTEAIGYVGAALLLAAGASLASRVWEDTDELARITVLAIATAVLIWLGWAFRASAEPGRPPGRRCGSRRSGPRPGSRRSSPSMSRTRARPPFTRDRGARSPPLYLVRRKALQHIAVPRRRPHGSVSSSSTSRRAGVRGVGLAAMDGGGLGVLPPSAGLRARVVHDADGGANVAIRTDAGLWPGSRPPRRCSPRASSGATGCCSGSASSGCSGFDATIQTYLGGGAGTVAGLAIAGFVVIIVALLLSRSTARRQMQG